MSVLASRLLAVHHSLSAASLPHAFGGAIALAYWTREPRGTRDLDVNVFIDSARSGAALDALPYGVAVGEADRRAALRHGQVRVMWEETPLDLFFNTDKFHSWVGARVVSVPFEGEQIPILSGEALMVFKAMFNRTRDWADVEAMVDAGSVDGREALAQLSRIVGAGDSVVERLTSLLG